VGHDHARQPAPLAPREEQGTLLRGEAGRTLAPAAGVYQRTGGKRLPGLRLLFGLEPSAQIVRVLQFERTARAVVAQRWRANFEQAFVRALSTAR